jgi:hypothetical protein
MRLVYQAGPTLASAAGDAIVDLVVDAESIRATSRFGHRLRRCGSRIAGLYSVPLRMTCSTALQNRSSSSSVV